LSSDGIQKQQRALFPSSSPDLLKEFFERQKSAPFGAMQNC
jgi:hypothetical protein